MISQEVQKIIESTQVAYPNLNSTDLDKLSMYVKQHLSIDTRSKMLESQLESTVSLAVSVLAKLLLHKVDFVVTGQIKNVRSELEKYPSSHSLQTCVDLTFDHLLKYKEKKQQILIYQLFSRIVVFSEPTVGSHMIIRHQYI